MAKKRTPGDLSCSVVDSFCLAPNDNVARNRHCRVVEPGRAGYEDPFTRDDRARVTDLLFER